MAARGAGTAGCDNHDVVNSVRKGSTLRPLAEMAAPIVLANTVQAGHQLINTLWVGRLGAGAVAANTAHAGAGARGAGQRGNPDRQGSQLKRTLKPSMMIILRMTVCDCL